MAYINNIFALAKQNTFFRKEIVTGAHSQVVIMSIPPGGDIGEETHEVDQTLVFVEGEGEAVLNGKTTKVSAGSLSFVPAGTVHNFINTGAMDMKLFTIYAPAEHKPGIVHETKADAKAEEHD